MELAKIAPPVSQDDVYATGRLTTSFEGGAAGLEMLSVQRTAAGGGQIVLNQGVIHNLNIVREILNKLSMIPGLSARLESRLPPDYKAKIDQNDTELEPVQIPFFVQGPIWTVPQLTVVSQTFTLTGTARGDWTNETFQAQFSVFLDPDLSLALIRSVEELRFLAGPDGRIEIPGSLQGAGGKISFVPNVPDLASRVVAGKAQQVFNGLFERKTDPSQTPQDPGEGQTRRPFGAASQAPVSGQKNTAPAPAEMLLGQLLGEVLGGSSGQSGAQSRE